MSTLFHSGKVITPLRTYEDTAVLVSDDGKISYMGPTADVPKFKGASIDLEGRILAPGLIDIHTHGGYGVLFEDPSNIEKLPEYNRWAASQGVTGYLRSFCAPSKQKLLTLISAHVNSLDELISGAECLGFHIEGPYLSLEKKGAFNPDWLRHPTLDEAQNLLDAGKGYIRQITIAPELKNAYEAAAFFYANNVVTAIGHTNVDYETAMQALQAGFTHVTHMYNAMSGFNHRAPGVVGAVLTSESINAELIADGIHVHPSAIQVLYRCLGKDRIVLITDAMSAAGLSDGEYSLVGHLTIVKNGSARLTDGTLAGSVATLRNCVKNAKEYLGISLQDVIQMATLNPAKAMGFSDRKGSIQVGKDADLIVIDEEMNIYETYVAGRLVYQQT